MKFILEETRSTIHKSQKNMVKYYNQRYISVLVFHSGNKIFLDFLDIYTTYSSMSGIVHTGSESLQDGLRDVWTCGMILASAYVLCYLSAMWS